jgi:hypothetical protein
MYYTTSVNVSYRVFDGITWGDTKQFYQAKNGPLFYQFPGKVIVEDNNVYAFWQLVEGSDPLYDDTTTLYYAGKASDRDADGLDDACDYLHYDVAAVETKEIPHLKIVVEGTPQFHGNKVKGRRKVLFFEDVDETENNKIVELDWNFVQERVLDLSKVIVQKQPSGSSYGAILISGLDLPAGESKTIYLDRIAQTNVVCIKDAEISSIEEITDDCTGVSEFLINCPDSLEGYTCNITEDGSKYKITGLLHSGAEEVISGGSSGGGTGGGGIAIIPEISTIYGLVFMALSLILTIYQIQLRKKKHQRRNRS